MKLVLILEFVVTISSMEIHPLRHHQILENDLPLPKSPTCHAVHEQQKGHNQRLFLRNLNVATPQVLLVHHVSHQLQRTMKHMRQQTQGMHAEVHVKLLPTKMCCHPYQYQLVSNILLTMISMNFHPMMILRHLRELNPKYM